MSADQSRGDRRHDRDSREPLAGLQQALFAGSRIEELGRYRSRCAYCGLSDALTSEPFALFFEPPTVALDDWLAERPALWFKIVIPAALKWETRDKLDQSNITERLLFPGLAGLTTWLKRHHSPRN